MDFKLSAFILMAFSVALVCSAELKRPPTKSKDADQWKPVPSETKPKRSGAKPPSTACQSKKMFNCLVNPCDVAYCPQYPTSYCKANYCGGCKAEFFYYKGPKQVKIKDCGKECSEACPRDYNPVCGSDGNTYGNPCTFNAAKCLSKGVLRFVKNQECDSNM